LKGDYSFKCFILVGTQELILHSYQDSMLANIEVSFTNKSLLGNRLSKGAVDFGEMQII